MYREVLGATVMGSVRDFQVQVALKENWKPFHARNRGGMSKAEEDEMGR